MEWFRNLKTAQKVIGLVILMATFIGIVGYVGFYFTDVMSNNSKNMYANRLLPIRWLNLARVHINANNANVLNLIIEQDNTKYAAIIDDIEKRVEETNKLLADYEKTKLDPFEVENLAKLKELIDKFRDLRSNIIQLAKADKNEEAYKFYKANMATTLEMAKTIGDLAEYNANIADKLNKDNESASVLANNIILAAIIAALALAIVLGLFIAKMISTPLIIMVKAVQEVANGNLAIEKIDIKSKDEVGQLATAFNTMTESLRNLVKQVIQSIDEMSSGSEEMNAAADQTAQGAQQVATSVTQLAAGAQQISQNVEEGANNLTKMNKVIQNISGEAENIAELGNDTENNANTGKEHVKKAVDKIDSIRVVSTEISDTIDELGKLSSEIETIVDLIKNIAGQTNLLALNAAIEAARAGEHGKGFAVVADEVKKLATQSGEATDKITEMIKEIQNKTSIAVSTMNKGVQEVDDGVLVVNDAGKALENIIDQVKLANSKIQGINEEIGGVAKNSEEIVKVIENVSAVTEETAASAEEIASITEEQTASIEEINASSQSLAKIAENLQKQVSVFTV